MSKDTSAIVSGPATIQFDGTDYGHTQGGSTATITPQNRARMVDQFGVSEVDIIHTGDQVRVNLPFAQWDATVMGVIYNPGLSAALGSGSSGSTNNYLGIGRIAGFTYVPKYLQMIPLVTADVNKFIEFWRVVAVGELTLGFTHENDRVIGTDFACLIDQNQTDGEVIGRLQAA